MDKRNGSGGLWGNVVAYIDKGNVTSVSGHVALISVIFVFRFIRHFPPSIELDHITRTILHRLNLARSTVQYSVLIAASTLAVDVE